MTLFCEKKFCPYYSGWSVDMGKLYPAWKFSSCGNWDSPSLSKEEFKTSDIQGEGLNSNDDLLCYTAKLLTFCTLVHFLDNSKI